MCSKNHSDELQTQISRDLGILGERGISRRRMLGFVAATGSMALLGGTALAQGRPELRGGMGGGFGPGPGAGRADPLVTAEGPDGQCMNFAWETNGPFPADGTNGSRNGVLNALADTGIVRRNVLADIDDPGQRVNGVPLELSMQLVDVNNACAPLTGHAVYIWSCDAVGDYSLYNQPERSWLRGVQQSDDRGIVRFTTLFPGCYPGRYPHIHFEVFSSLNSATTGRDALLISQLAVPQSDCDAVFETPHYASSERTFARNNSIERDNVFGDNASERISIMTLRGGGTPADGYDMSAVVGLAA